jgi:hypothetical protein
MKKYTFETVFSLLFVSLVYFGVVKAAGTDNAQAAPLKPGTYQCFTITTMYTPSKPADDPSEIARRNAGLKTRGMVAPQMLLAPAAFGNAVLDDNGKYRLTNVRSTGQYGFNKATGRPIFTGDLGAMQQGEYSGTGTAFIVSWQGVSYQCGLTAKEGEASSEGALERQAAYLASSGSVLKSATAQDFNGNFEGSYVCLGSATYLRLSLSAKPDGSISGAFHFGGMHTPEISYSVGSFTLVGTWQGSHFSLKGQQWVKQPAGYEMVDIDGDLTTLGSAGKILNKACTVFAVKRVRN